MYIYIYIYIYICVCVCVCVCGRQQVNYLISGISTFLDLIDASISEKFTEFSQNLITFFLIDKLNDRKIKCRHL